MTEISSHKEDALSQILSIAKHNEITLKELEQAFKTINQANNVSGTSILQKLFSYLGGIFLFAGVATFIGMHWEDMNLAGHLIVTLGAGFVAFIMALTCLSKERFIHAATPLFLIAALLESTGIGIMLDAFSTSKNIHHGAIFISVVMLIQHGVTFFVKKRTVLAFISIGYLFLLYLTLMDMVDVDGDIMSTTLGGAMLFISYSLSNSRHVALSPFTYFFGSIGFLAGSFEIMEGSIFEPVYLGVTALLIYLSTAIRSRTLLFVSCTAMLCYIGYYTVEHFKDSLGWVLSLILIGLIMLGMGSFAFKLDRKMQAR